MRKLFWIVLGLGLPVTAGANTFGLVVQPQEGQSDHDINAAIYHCEQLASQVQQPEVDGALQDGVKSAARVGTVGAAAGAISGNSGSSAAKTGAAVGASVGLLRGSANRRGAQRHHEAEQKHVVRQCLSNDGYTVLN
ncbi:hypothetical protein [Ferrimonas marina]|uniref:Glycine-zipper containing OmpA-like membrane domain-containing protein n=1 Tax=Ferrimonas marina TaxID=299255 RepID=A0A1M5NKL0_9GAMM|nr:hypothetical protein [Ferrimonas marina]SHG89997.1 hypothetical protein SAMN02745129_1091 [Ferrimonas marina]